MIVVIEGIDGSGKTTVAQKLAKQWGFNYRHFPYNLNPVLAKRNLQEAMAEDLILHQPTSEQDWVLDRYLPSSFVYGMPDELYTYLLRVLPKPDVSILLDVSATVSRERCEARGEEDPLGYDLQSLTSKQLLINRYKRLHWDAIIDADQNIDQVISDLLQLVKHKRLM